VTTFGQRIDGVSSISASRRAELRNEAAKIVAEQVYPAWQKAIAFLEPLLARASDDAGLCRRFQGGSEASSNYLRRFTTTDVTADQIYEIGLRAVERNAGKPRPNPGSYYLRRIPREPIPAA
jgi:uncharacterized protein (DUF885 family)